MTIRAYLTDKLKAFGISEAYLVDFTFATGLYLESEYNPLLEPALGQAMTGIVEELILAPKMTNVSESGFSMSWDMKGLAQWYMWLCKKWGVKVNPDVLASTGCSIISDKSSKW